MSEHLEREVANMSSLIQSIMKQHNDISSVLNSRPRIVSNNLHVLDPDRVSRDEYRRLQDDIAEVRALVASMAETIKPIARALEFLQGTVEIMADDIAEERDRVATAAA